MTLDTLEGYQLVRLSKIQDGDVLMDPDTGGKKFADASWIGVFVDDQGREAGGSYVYRKYEPREWTPVDIAGYQNVRFGESGVGDLILWGSGENERIVVADGDAACIGRKILPDGTVEFDGASLVYRVYRKIPTPKQDAQRATQPRENLANVATKLVLGDRNESYGNPRDDYEGTAKVWSGLLRKKLKADITPEEAILMMVGLKLNREANKHKDDNIIDAHGYLICHEWVRTGEKPTP